jgi:hypothetical protein
LGIPSNRAQEKSHADILREYPALDRSGGKDIGMVIPVNHAAPGMLSGAVHVNFFTTKPQ